MKFRSVTRTRMVPHTRDGRTHDVPEDYEVLVPKIPLDLDALALKGAGGLVLILTLISIGWSTLSIGSLLHGGIGYAAAALFDLSWIINLLLEWLGRFDAEKRTFAKRFGWGLLVCTMGAIMWHGLLMGSVSLAVVGAVVSLIAKTLWWGIMRHVDRDLSRADAHWVAQETSAANAKLAIAGVRRQVARAEARAVAELLAAEQIRDQFAGLLKEDPRELFPQSGSLLELPEDDATTSRRHDAIAPTGAGAEVRREPAAPQLSKGAPAPYIRPEGLPVFEMPEPAQEPEDDQEEEPRVPEQRFRPMAVAVRGLVEEGETDPKAIMAALPKLIGREPNGESVRREIRAAKARLSSKNSPSPYL